MFTVHKFENNKSECIFKSSEKSQWMLKAFISEAFIMVNCEPRWIVKVSSSSEMAIPDFLRPNYLLYLQQLDS